MRVYLISLLSSKNRKSRCF